MREAQQRGQQVLRCGSARGRSADRPQSELGSCRTARPARAPRGGLPRTDAIPDPTDRPHSAAPRALPRSGPRHSSALLLHHRKHPRTEPGSARTTSRHASAVCHLAGEELDTRLPPSRRRSRCHAGPGAA
jgi:hypothetical protein